MERSRIDLLLLIAAGVLGAGALIGCNDTIEPFSEMGSYSVYGNLSFQQEPHFFRVRPLKQSLNSSPESLDVTVTLTNRSNGRTRVLQDSVILFDGIRTHNYWSDFKVEPATTYELRVENSRLPPTSVQTTTPTGVDAVVIPDSVQECGNVEVRFREAESPVEIYVGFRFEGEMHWVRRAEVESPPNREHKVLQFELGSVLIAVIPTGLREPPPCTQLEDTTIQIAYLYVDPERSQETAGAQVTYDPTQQERIDNGVGFFGAYRRDTITAKADTTFPVP